MMPNDNHRSRPCRAGGPRLRRQVLLRGVGELHPRPIVAGPAVELPATPAGSLSENEHLNNQWLASQNAGGGNV